MKHDFLIAVMGGVMLGLAAVGYLYVNGRISGIIGLIACSGSLSKDAM